MCEFLLQTNQYLNEEIKEPGIDTLGKSISGIHWLLLVQSDVNFVRLAAPFAVKESARQLRAELIGIDFKEIGRKLETCKRICDLWIPNLTCRLTTRVFDDCIVAVFYKINIS